MGNNSQVSTQRPDLLQDTDRAIAEGAVGGTAQAVGGPLAADGAIGKHFTEQGAVGGTVQENLGEKK